MGRNAMMGGVFLVIFCASGRAAEDRQKPAAEVPELMPLNGYVGNWDVESTFKNSEHPEGVRATGSSTSKWIHNGRYLRQTWSVKASDGSPAFNGSNIRTYDPRKKAYRGWSFNSSGETEESRGAWDAKTRTLTWTVPENNGGGKTIVKSSFPEDGRESWSIVVKDSDGKVLADVRGTATRRTK